MSTKHDHRKQKRVLLKKKKRAEKRKSSGDPRPRDNYRMSDMASMETVEREDNPLLQLLDNDDLFRTSEEQVDIKELHLRSFEVTDEPIDDETQSRVPEDLKDRFESLYYLTREDPKRAVVELEVLYREHPEIPRVYNYLSIAYQVLGNQEKARKVTAEGYRRHPDYLFTKVNHANYCLNEGKLDEVEAIIGKQPDLTLMYPGRKKFHISEVMGFYGLMGLYLAETGRLNAARTYYKVMRRLGPEHNSTKLLGVKILQKGFSKVEELTEQAPKSE